mmetsp:Transcript_22301/g.73058  ORF Transcript_22301/g.73058 Transcript_22301/m.73058 type:complete len:280 (+) Transcript_22301:247-1086(+)
MRSLQGLGRETWLERRPHAARHPRLGAPARLRSAAVPSLLAVVALSRRCRAATRRWAAIRMAAVHCRAATALRRRAADPRGWRVPGSRIVRHAAPRVCVRRGHAADPAVESQIYQEQRKARSCSEAASRGVALLPLPPAALPPRVDVLLPRRRGAVLHARRAQSDVRHVAYQPAAESVCGGGGAGYAFPRRPRRRWRHRGALAHPVPRTLRARLWLPRGRAVKDPIRWGHSRAQRGLAPLRSDGGYLRDPTAIAVPVAPRPRHRARPARPAAQLGRDGL